MSLFGQRRIIDDTTYAAWMSAQASAGGAPTGDAGNATEHPDATQAVGASTPPADLHNWPAPSFGAVRIRRCRGHYHISQAWICDDGQDDDWDIHGECLTFDQASHLLAAMPAT